MGIELISEYCFINLTMGESSSNKIILSLIIDDRQ